MPVSRNSPVPVIEEVRPSNAASYDSTNNKSSSPVAPPSPKTVHFAEPAAGFERSTRPATNLEEWSAWRFEDHASQCTRCEDPVATHRSGQHLCEIGHSLARDVALNFHDYAGKIYSRRLDEKGQPVRVELNPGYFRTRLLLKSMALSAKQLHRRTTSPETHHSSQHHTTRPSHREHKSTSKRHQQILDDSSHVTALLEPFNNTSLHDWHHHHHHPHHHQHTTNSTSKPSKHHTTRHDRIVVTPSSVAPQHTAVDTDHRGSLYESGMRRSSQRDMGYRVEVRTPKSPLHHHRYGNQELFDDEMQREALWRRDRSAPAGRGVGLGVGLGVGYFM